MIYFLIQAIIYPIGSYFFGEQHRLHILNGSGIFITISLFLIFCRSNINIFETYLLILCNLYIPITAWTNPDFGCYGMVLSIVMPAFLLLVTLRKSFFLVTSIFQILVLNLVLRDKIINQFLLSDPVELGKSLILTHSVVLFHVCIFCWIFCTKFQASQKVVETYEKQEKEQKRQRLFFLRFSHGFRNPLNSLLGNLQLALLHDLPSDIQEKLKSAKICGELILSMVNNILDRGKHEIGNLEFTPSPTRVVEALTKIWGVCSELIKERGLQGYLYIEKSVPKVLKIDQYRISQILLNLVGNSIKYTEKGSIDICLQDTPTTSGIFN